MDNKLPDVPRHYVTLHIGLKLPGSSGVADKEEVIAFIQDRFESFSVTEALGVFRGEREPALIVGIAVSDPQEAAESAAALREHFHWEGVGIVFQGVYHRATIETTPTLAASQHAQPKIGR